MREIKFRAYVKDKKKVLPVYSLDFSWIESEPVTIASCGDLNCGMCLDGYENENVEIMQYTGLRDINGKEIYEGDILECHHKTKGNVFFHDSSFRLSSDQCELNIEDIHSYDDLNQYLIEDNDLVVLGNIYENPELMEDSK